MYRQAFTALVIIGFVLSSIQAQAQGFSTHGRGIGAPSGSAGGGGGGGFGNGNGGGGSGGGQQGGGGGGQGGGADVKAALEAAAKEAQEKFKQQQQEQKAEMDKIAQQAQKNQDDILQAGKTLREQQNEAAAASMAKLAELSKLTATIGANVPLTGNAGLDELRATFAEATASTTTSLLKVVEALGNAITARKGQVTSANTIQTQLAGNATTARSADPLAETFGTRAFRGFTRQIVYNPPRTVPIQ